jgi:hypothetical protein
VKPWPFRGCSLDFVDEIHPTSSKGHRFILVATDYFTKWTEAMPLRNMTQGTYCSLVWNILTIDQGASFMSHQFKEFVGSLRNKLLNSSPYYAQTNGQDESSNKTLIKLIKKKIEEKLRRWHEVLSEALWAYRMAKHGVTKVTPFELVYG